MMKNLVIALALLGCGSKQPPAVSNAGSGEPAGPRDTRTEIEKRRDTACESLGPRVTQCAVDDARKAFAEGTITKAQHDEITASGVQAKNTEEFIDSCKNPKTAYSSRQIRVLEVCQKEESECEPLMACLDNLHKP